MMTVMNLFQKNPSGHRNDSKRITALKPDSADGNRVIVKVDGKKVATVSANSITELDLHVDQPWDDTLASAVAEKAEYDKTMRAALTILDRRAKSVRQLAIKLRQKGFQVDMIDRVTERLVELGVLNDHLFGQMLIRDTSARKPAGERLLKTKLMQAGLEPGTIDQLLEEFSLPHEETVAQVKDLAIKILRTTNRRQEEPEAAKRRLWASLARRGFDADAIGQALNDVMQDQ